ncbi:TetR/AcrR family transcriptional regulator [Dactylosporangium salmoneum]|uniref:TetR/AcrR family transcriptional regulator n=1 Tax=Dactylosporangium salmoneum TaxID=53361 RepID=A0ABN3FAC4_9ACTN
MTEGAVAERGRRLEPDERRGQILSCAVRLFGERPFAEVSTTDIANAAGVARGLINHYFGTKKGLYVEAVRVLVTIPAVAVEQLPAGDLATRVDASVTWFLDVVSRHATSWLAVVDGGGLGRDPDVRRVLAEADEVAAGSILVAVGLGAAEGAPRAMIRAYCGLAKAAAREWLERGALTREEVHTLLATTLVTLVRDVFPRTGGGRP